jgi:glycerol-3-phosphate acyltransferase PlsY
VTLLGDTGKGWLSVALARYIGPNWGITDTVVAAVALAVFLGHLFPVFLRFQGGKGVATALGVLLGFNPWMGLAAAATWLTVAVVSRISSLSALTAAVLGPVYALYFLGLGTSTMVIFIMSLLLVWKHKSNIASLMAGKEAKIGERSLP